MPTVREHLLEQAKQQFARHENPIVAIDVLAAKKRGERLQALAEKLGGLDEDAALAALLVVREASRAQTYKSVDAGEQLVFAYGELQWFEGIVDPVERAKVGWIELSDMTPVDEGAVGYPYYRRMLGINHVVASLKRERAEPDEAWLTRRKAWLSTYHPDVPVRIQGLRAEGAFSTVGKFLNNRHLIETALRTATGIQTKEGLFDVVEFYEELSPEGYAGAVRPRPGVRYDKPSLKMRNYVVKVLTAT